MTADQSQTPFTLEQLAEFDGVKSEKIYIGCNGLVFDVSDASFYKPGSAYGIFAGKDCTVSLAKGDLSGNMNNKTKEVPLEPEEQGRADNFCDKFKGKYPIMGVLSL